MQDKKVPSVRCLVDGFMKDLNGAKLKVDIVPGKFVMIAGNENYSGALPCLSQKLLNDVIMFLGPIPALPKAPAVDNIPDEVKIVAFGASQKIEQEIRLASGCTQMNV